jgi:glycosyltransferase involved in cell wall biosynthesis
MEIEKQPLVSILIPAYNPIYFEQALLSAIGQDYSHKQILVGDDSSGEAIYNITSAVSRAYPDISLIYLENKPPLREILSTQNLINISSGTFLQVLHDDDILLEGAVSSFVKYMLRNPNVSMIATPKFLIDSEGKELGISGQYFESSRMFEGRSVAYATCKRDGPIGHLGEPSHIFFKKNCLTSYYENINEYKGLTVTVGYDKLLVLKLLLNGDYIFYKSPLSCRRKHSMQSVRNPRVKNEGVESQVMLRKIIDLIKVYQFPSVLCDLGTP